MTAYALEQVGPLKVIEILSRNPDSQTPTVVMLHGYGADANDLAPLSHVLKMPEGSRWLVPDGPLEIPMGYYTGRAWAPINMEEWQRAMMEGRPRDLSGERPPELLSSQQKILEVLERKKVNLEKVIFAGFSQGAMLATQLALTCGVRPLGLIIFSGSLINAAEWKTAAPKLEGFKFIQTHGLHDDVLSIQGADRLHNLLVESGLTGEYVKFEGGHEIPQIAIQKAQNYIFDLFPKDVWEKNDH